MQTDKTKPGTADAGGSQSRPGLADQAKDAARREMNEAKAGLHSAADKARSEASKAGRSVQSLMMDEIDKRKGMFCEGLEGVAHAMRKAADDLDKNEDAPAAPRMVHQAVNTIEDMADRLKYQSAEDIGRNLSRYGRENPTLFIAGALLAGLAAGRFLVASNSGSTRSRGSWDEDDYDRDQTERPAVLHRGPKGHEPSYGQSGAAQPGARPDTAAYGSGRHEDLPSGTGQPSATPSSVPGGARDLSYGQGGVGQPGGAQAGGVSNLGAGSGTAGFTKPATTPGAKDGKS